MDKLKRFDDNYQKIADATKSVREFVNGFVDPDSFVEWDAYMSGKSFVDGSDALGEGVLTGYATLDGFGIYLCAQNSAVLRGGFSAAQSDKICKMIANAEKSGVPFISVIDSAGAKVGEGISMLEGFGKLIASCTNASGSVLHVAVIKGTCVGLMSAYASLADVVYICDKDATVSLGAPMVLASRAGNLAPLQELFGAKAALKNGIADFSFASAADLRAKLSNLFYYLQYEETEVSDSPNRTSKNLNVYSVDAALAALADDGKYLEFGKEFAPELRTALANVNGLTVAILATDATKNDGFLSVSALKKATRFLNFATDIPVVTLVDSLGLAHDMSSDRAASAAVAELLKTVALSECRKIGVLAGKAVGLSYLAFASKELGFDYTVAFATAELSAILPEVAVEVLFADDISAAKDPAKAREQLLAKYTEDMENPYVAAKDGYVDNVIEPAMLRPYIASLLQIL